MDKIVCIYCKNSMDTLYYSIHLKTKKHFKSKKKLIDDSLIRFPKVVNNIIFEYFNDNFLEKYTYNHQKNLPEIILEPREQSCYLSLFYNCFPFFKPDNNEIIYYPYEN